MLTTLKSYVTDLKVSADKVTHHFHQKGAFGLNGEVSFTPKRHRGDSRTGGLADCKAAGDSLADLADYCSTGCKGMPGVASGPWHTAGRLYSGNLAETRLNDFTVDNCR